MKGENIDLAAGRVTIAIHMSEKQEIDIQLQRKKG